MNNKRPPIAFSAELGKAPPQAVEIERALLRNILTIGTSAMDAIVSTLRSDEIFYREEHRRIFIEILNLYRRGTTIDMFTVQEAVAKSAPEHEHMIIDLITEGPSIAISNFTNADYVNILTQKFVRRRALQAYYELGQKLYDDSLEDAQAYYVLENAYKEMTDIITGRQEANTMERVMQKSVEKLNERLENRRSGTLPGVTTGLRKLDEMLAGWQKGELYVIAARPGMGKTALALHFAQSAGRDQKPVLFFSLEMADYKLTDRMLIGETNIDSAFYHHASLTQYDYDNILNQSRFLSNIPIFFDEKSGVDIDYLISASRLAHRKHDIRLIIIDYLQLIDMREKPGQTRDQAIGNVTRKLKGLSKELSVPVILLSQLNRALEGRASKEPNLSDLRESGNIEQDADVVLMLFRPAHYNIDNYKNFDSTNVLWILTEKYRSGAKLDIPISHNNTLTKFYNYDTSKSVPY